MDEKEVFLTETLYGERQRKKQRIIAEALRAHLRSMLLEEDIRHVNTEELQLCAQCLAEKIDEVNDVARIVKMAEKLGA